MTKNKLIPPMKATQLILTAALFTGLASFSFAGMGSQYWTQQSKNAEAQKAKAAASAETSKETMNCACCAGGK